MCLIYSRNSGFVLQLGRTAFDVAMENGHLSSAGRLFLLTPNPEAVTYKVPCFSCCANDRVYVYRL